MAPLPTPVRAAIGLAALTVEQARTLPDRALELPVLVVSTALQFSVRVQQRYAELTLRGDELLSRLHELPEEPPSWATFDEEEPEPVSTSEPESMSEVEPEPESTSEPEPAPAAQTAPAADTAPAGIGEAELASDSALSDTGEAKPRRRRAETRPPAHAEPSPFDNVPE